jgi:hypothetical protein
MQTPLAAAAALYAQKMVFQGPSKHEMRLSALVSKPLFFNELVASCSASSTCTLGQSDNHRVLWNAQLNGVATHSPVASLLQTLRRSGSRQLIKR